MDYTREIDNESCTLTAVHPLHSSFYDLYSQMVSILIFTSEVAINSSTIGKSIRRYNNLWKKPFKSNTALQATDDRHTYRTLIYKYLTLQHWGYIDNLLDTNGHTLFAKPPWIRYRGFDKLLCICHLTHKIIKFILNILYLFLQLTVNMSMVFVEDTTQQGRLDAGKIIYE